MENIPRNPSLNLRFLGVYPPLMEAPKEGIVLDREGNEIYSPESARKQSYSAPHIRVIRGGPLLGALLLVAIPILLFFGIGIVLIVLAVMTVLGILSRVFGRR